MRIVRLRAARASTAIILIMAVLVSVAVVLGARYMLVKRAAQAGADARQRAIGTIGLNRPVTNRLDPRYTDADGDLVADAPADASALLDPDTLTFCYLAVDETADAEAFKTAWADFVTNLAKVTGKKVEYVILESEPEQLKALRDGALHVTAFNTGRVPIAVNACGFVPVATVPDSTGNGKSHIEIITPAGSPLKTLNDLKGRELALTEVGSNSGYKAPLVLLKDHNLLPEQDFLIRYSGSHTNSIRGINEGKYPAAAVAADVLMRLESSGEITKDKYRSLFKSENFPTAGLGYTHNLKPELAAKVKEALLTFDWQGTSMEKMFDQPGQKKLVPATFKEDWANVRRIDDAIGYRHVIDAQSTTTESTTRGAEQ